MLDCSFKYFKSSALTDVGKNAHATYVVIMWQKHG